MKLETTLNVFLRLKILKKKNYLIEKEGDSFWDEKEINKKEKKMQIFIFQACRPMQMLVGIILCRCIDKWIINLAVIRSADDLNVPYD